jgi:very-short-patch-repair endonuclease
VHRVARLDQDEWSMVDGIPVTTPARTLADLAGVVGSRELELAVARAEREGLVSGECLSGMLRRYRNRAGARVLRAVLQRRGGPALTRSEAEDRFLSLVRTAALPPPETNVRIGSYEIDFLWRSEGIAVEIDGYRHHSSKPRFESDRRKDTWLLAGGIKVIRLSWQQITRDGIATAVQVAQALALASPARG